MTTSLVIDTQLFFEVDGEVPVTISGSGDTLNINFLSYHHLFILNRKHQISHRGRVTFIRELYKFLKAGNLSAAFNVSGCKVALLSPNYSGGVFNRLTGLGPLRLSFFGLLAALFTK